MPLIVEDGTGTIANANSYVARADLINYAAARGVTLADSEATDILAIAAMDYLETRDYNGDPTLGIVGVFQPLQFPRENVVLGEQSGTDDITGALFYSPIVLPNDVIPLNLKNAQCELALIKNSGVDLMPVKSAGDGVIKREKVDVIETEYFEGSTFVEPLMPRVDALLKPLLAGPAAGGAFGLVAVRV